MRLATAANSNSDTSGFVAGVGLSAASIDALAIPICL